VFHLAAWSRSAAVSDLCAVEQCPFLALLVLFGFWTLGMHAGYAIYFRSSIRRGCAAWGSGFCFNFARFHAIMLVVNGYLQQQHVRSKRRARF